MNRIFTICLALLSLAGYSQEGAFKIGFRLAPSSNIATVKDKDGTPSNIILMADGYTVKESNAGGVGVSFFIDYFFTEHIAFSTGLWFTQKNFNILNYDGYTGPGRYNYNGNPNDWDPYYNNGYYPYSGDNFANGYRYSYSGKSFYKTTYLQIPLLFKFVTSEIAKNLKIYGTFGPTIDLRIKEGVDGSDFAHFWNMAQNNPSWARRDRNAANKPVNLFNPLDITLFASAGITYNLTENFELFGGIMANKGFVNAINPKLRFAEPHQTPVNEALSMRSFLVGMELGLTYRLK